MRVQALLQQAEPRWVRCIKPNAAQAPHYIRVPPYYIWSPPHYIWSPPHYICVPPLAYTPQAPAVFEEPLVVNQLRYLGVMETVRPRDLEYMGCSPSHLFPSVHTRSHRLASSRIVSPITRPYALSHNLLHPHPSHPSLTLAHLAHFHPVPLPTLQVRIRRAGYPVKCGFGQIVRDFQELHLPGTCACPCTDHPPIPAHASAHTRHACALPPTGLAAQPVCHPAWPLHALPCRTRLVDRQHRRA